MDFARNNIKHEVKMVNNGFKRYTYINFLKFEDSSFLETIFPPIIEEVVEKKIEKRKII
jgi:hypothetical protein